MVFQLFGMVENGNGMPIVERTTNGRKSNDIEIVAGQVVRTSFGYSYDKTFTGKLVINEDQAKIVRFIFNGS